MLPYETELHSEAIFSKLVSAWLAAKGTMPSDTDVRAWAKASVDMTEGFSAAVSRIAPSPIHTGVHASLKPISFERLVHEWQRHATRAWKKTEKDKVRQRFKRYLFPSLGFRPAADIKPVELVTALKGVEDAGYLPLAHLILRETSRVYRFAIAAGYAVTNPASEIRGALYRWKPRRRTTILLPERVGELLRAIASYNGYSTSKYMLRLLPLVFVRPGELRQAEWVEIDLKASQWRIPARRMKARRPHIVPLSRQAKAIFREVHRRTGQGKYVFASSSSHDGIMSEHLCTTMLQSVGFGGEMTMSGFRSMAATLLSEQGWSPDAIERQLSHQDPRPIRRVYNFAEYLPERRRIMQAWADYLHRLAAGKTN